jgi:hypothetical protein
MKRADSRATIAKPSRSIRALGIQCRFAMAVRTD